MSLAEGDAIAPFIIESVEFEPMKTMIAILVDPNPIHVDPAIARSLGLDGVVNQGPINLTWLIECATRAVGGPERLLRATTRFLGNVFVGQRFVCTGTVTRIDRTAGYAHLDLTATADERPVMTATAVITLDA